MKKIKCPYCGRENVLDPDDYYNVEDGDEIEEECRWCEREFMVRVHIPQPEHEYEARKIEEVQP